MEQAQLPFTQDRMSTPTEKIYKGYSIPLAIESFWVQTIKKSYNQLTELFKLVNVALTETQETHLKELNDLLGEKVKE